MQLKQKKRQIRDNTRTIFYFFQMFLCMAYEQNSPGLYRIVYAKGR